MVLVRTGVLCELPCPPALGAIRPSLVEDRASCFCVGTCTRRGHSGFRLRRRLPFTGGSECPTPPRWTLSHNRRCTLSVAFEHRRERGEYRPIRFNRRGRKRGGERASNSSGRCLPSLLASSTLAEEGGLAPSITAKIVFDPVLTSPHRIGGGIRFLRQLSGTPDDCGCDRAGSLMQLRPSNEGVVCLCIHSLLPALSETESVGVRKRKRTEEKKYTINADSQSDYSVALAGPIYEVSHSRCICSVGSTR
jgi:hypothetical protein